MDRVIQPDGPKAELLQVGIFFLIHLLHRKKLLLKKLEIEETKTTYVCIHLFKLK